MSEKPKDEPQRSAAGKRESEAREARLAAALRANLQRRKAQVRERIHPDAKQPPHPNPLPGGEREPRGGG